MHIQSPDLDGVTWWFDKNIDEKGESIELLTNDIDVLENDQEFLAGSRSIEINSEGKQ
jgi:hypothetical protein